MNKEKTTSNYCVITIINTDPATGKIPLINGTPFIKSCGDTRTPDRALIDIYIS